MSKPTLLVVKKGGDRYVFYYVTSEIKSLVQTIGRFAANPLLNLTWHDASIVLEKIRREQESAK